MLWAVAVTVTLLCAVERHAQAAPEDSRSRAGSEPPETLSEDPDAEQAVLYTIGPGATVFERWGHSLLCFQPRSAFSSDGTLKAQDVPDTPALIDTSCFDFGVFPREPISSVVAGSMRGEALFVPRELAYQTAVGRYFWLDRTIERQVLHLSPDQVFDLRDRMNEITLDEKGYSYHPFSNNCASQLRDTLAAFSGGKLSPDGSTRSGPTLRESAEEGFSGQVLSLLALELFIGATADEPTSAWQRAAFPKGLKALMEEQLGARSHRVYKQSWTPLPTSVHAGRGLLLVVAVFLSAALFWGAKRRGPLQTEGGSAPGSDGIAWRRSVQVFGFLSAAVGLVAVALRYFSVYPEFKSSWIPLIFFPLDAALPWMQRSVRRRYIGARLLCACVLALLSLFHLLAQPLLTAALFVALPMMVLGFFELRGDPSEAQIPPRNTQAAGGAGEAA